MAKLIRHDAVVEDDWIVLDAGSAIDDVHPGVRSIVPLALWTTARESLLARGDVGVWLGPTDEPGVLAADVAELPLIAVAFPSFGDGRGFSTARLLRQRYGFRGELRAIGDVFRDQLFFMRECGFDAFSVRADLDPEKEIVGLQVFDRVYTHSVRTPRPWFRDREGVTSGTSS
ncbi:MAG: DUF934 domain-containing protein [Pseudomonadota bacterium]|nr:DUF934 domain-containing protein [Pseudomonadota bacterium]